MATIEPRLIHLLNDPQPPSLPSLHEIPLDIPTAVSLPPIELDASYRSEHAATSTHIPPLHLLSDDFLAKQASRSGDNVPAAEPAGRVLKSAPSLQQLLGDTEPSHTSSSLPLRMLVEDPVELLDDPSTKKRHRGVSQKDDFMQLPQPLKKQKSTQQVVPPIIAALREPPPNPGVFPPIESGLKRGAVFAKEYPSVEEDRPGGAAPGANTSDSGEKSTEPPKGKRRVAKPRRKWSDEETNQLLLGVHRHGVGKWTSILDDKDFKFNDRTAGDLKDRFRTCCPDELRGLVLSAAAARDSRRAAKTAANARPAAGRQSTGKGGNQYHNSGLPKPSKASLPSGTAALAASDEAAADAARGQHSRHRTERELLHPSTADSDSASGPLGRQRKSRAHRKKLEDLAELGIHAPFKKSHRRERRPFTEQDDKEILEGLEHYGPAWTKIQRDKRFHLMNRQPTDLRDRVRNKYPEIYSKIEKGSFHAKGKRGGSSKDGQDGEVGEERDDDGESSQHSGIRPHDDATIEDREPNGEIQDGIGGGSGGDRLAKANGEAAGNTDLDTAYRSVSGGHPSHGVVAGGQLLEPTASTTIELPYPQHIPVQEQPWSNPMNRSMMMSTETGQKLPPMSPYPIPDTQTAYSASADPSPARWKGKMSMGLGISGVASNTGTDNAFLSPSEMDISRLLLDDSSSPSMKRGGNSTVGPSYPLSQPQPPYRQHHLPQRNVPQPQPLPHHVRYGEGPSPVLGQGYGHGPGR